jgi:hypothetical protein
MKLEAARKHQGAGYSQKSAKDNTHGWIIACHASSKVCDHWKLALRFAATA